MHSSNEHIYALLKLAKQEGLEKVYVHAFLDGRDVAPDSGADFVKELADKIEEIGVGEIATVSGRYYAMDRDKRFDRVELAFDAIVNHKGESFECPVQYVKDSYAKETYDEFVIPGYNKNVDGQVADGDSVIFANFRPDRAIQLATVMTNDGFYDHAFNNVPKNLTFVCMMKYADSVNGAIAFALPSLTNTLGDYLSAKGMKQLRIAETEKYAHVTFFFDGGVDKEIEGATRVLVNSPKVATYDLQPEMSAYEVAAIEEKGVGVVMKHFALNDSEQDRIGLGVWVNEQAAREIYLKAFQAPVEKGNANGVMIAYTRWGCTWSGGSKPLVTGILREEWGCDGLIITDNVLTTYVNGVDGVLAGVSTFDAMLPYVTKQLPDYKNDAVIVNAMREACHRNLYAIANSSGMNGIGKDTEIKDTGLLVVDVVRTLLIVFGALFVLSLVMWITRKRRFKKNYVYAPVVESAEKKSEA